MSLKIRLARRGARRRPFYRIVVSDVRAPRDGRFIETLGFYNPLSGGSGGEKEVKLDEERIQHWLSVGARPTDRVLRFLDAAGVMVRPRRHNPLRAKPKAKAQERAKAREEGRAKAEAAPAEGKPAALESAAPAAQEPAEGTPTTLESAEGKTAQTQPTALEPEALEPAAQEPEADTA